MSLISLVAVMEPIDHIEMLFPEEKQPLTGVQALDARTAVHVLDLLSLFQQAQQGCVVCFLLLLYGAALSNLVLELLLGLLISSIRCRPRALQGRLHKAFDLGNGVFPMLGFLLGGFAF